VGVLSELTVGEKGVLVALDLPENVQNHLMHMGFVPGAEVTALRRAPAGDPTLYGIDGLEIALRHETASAIQIRPIEIRSAATQAATIQPNGIRPAESQPAKIRSSDATAQPSHDSPAAPKRGSAIAPKFAEAAR
jgi:ferrous iron transport protein A